jgi:hypothetical protein
MNKALLMEIFQAIYQLEPNLNGCFNTEFVVFGLPQQISQIMPILFHYNVKWSIFNLAMADYP